jgi:hypothetical protein
LVKLTRPRSRSGLKVMIGHAAPARFLQLVQHARAVHAHVLAEEEDAVGLLEVVQHHGADAVADGLRQRHRGAFVAHVRAVGQVVVAVHARQQLVHIGGFQRGAAGAVEHDLLRVEPAQGAPISAKAWSQPILVAVAGGVPAQRHGQPALRLRARGRASFQLGHVWLSKKSAPMRLLVTSQAVALAPLSQNSAGCGCAGLAQAQLTQA